LFRVLIVSFTWARDYKSDRYTILELKLNFVRISLETKCLFLRFFCEKKKMTPLFLNCKIALGVKSELSGDAAC